MCDSGGWLCGDVLRTLRSLKSEDQNSLKSSESDNLCNGGLWIISCKSEKCVTMHSDYVKMP